MQSKRFIIVMMARSGSTWLITLLNGQPGVAAYEELMLPHPVKPKYAWLAEGAPDRFILRREKLSGPRPLRLFRYLADVEAHKPDAAATGFKINAAQLPGLPELLPLMILRGYRLIVLMRNNVFESSVSVIMMARSGRAGTVSHNREVAPPQAVSLDPAELVTLMRRRLRWHVALRALHAAWPWPSAIITYEDMSTDQVGTIQTVLRTIGVDTASVPVESPLKRRVIQPYSEMITNYNEIVATLRAEGLEKYLPVHPHD